MQAINKERVAGLLQGLAQFGKTEHGITRLAYTAEDKAAQEWLLKQIQDLQAHLYENPWEWLRNDQLYLRQ